MPYLNNNLWEMLWYYYVLCSKAELPPLDFRQRLHWYSFIYKSICGLLPNYLSSIKNAQYSIHSKDINELLLLC